MSAPAPEPRYTSPAPFNNHARVEMLAAQAGHGGTRIAALPELTNHFGTVHGGALFTVGEVAAARAVISALGDRMPGLNAITRTAQIRYLRAARGEITARAELAAPITDVLSAVAQSGRSTAPVRVALTDAQGLVVAEMAVEWHVAQRGAKPE